MNKHRVPFVIIFAVLTSLMLIVSSVGAAPKDSTTVSLSTAQSEYSASQDVLINVTISNPSNHSVRILKWLTPMDGVEEPLFSVKVNGEPVTYIGAIYKRPAATGNDYMTLKAGESVSTSINLGDYYDLSATGQYEILYAAESYILYNEKGNGAFSPDSLTSKAITLTVEGQAGKRKPTPTPTPTPAARWNHL